MCGIVGAVAERDVVPILIEGLKRLEYRGYDSAGVAVVDSDGCIDRVRMPGKVAELEKQTNKVKLSAHSGIAHTRWATHGETTQPYTMTPATIPISLKIFILPNHLIKYTNNPTSPTMNTV